MFVSAHWAKAFINSLEELSDQNLSGSEIDSGVDMLWNLSSCAVSLRGREINSSSIKTLEKIIRQGIKKANGFSEDEDLSPATETAVRFFVLMLKKRKIHYIDSVINEVKKHLNKKRGIVEVSLEYAAALPDEAKIITAIKSKTGAAGVNLARRQNANLIGGYRLRMGDKIADASIRLQLRKLEAQLAAGCEDGGS